MSRLLSRYWLLIPLLLAVIVVRDWVESAPVDIEVEATIDMRATHADYYLEQFKTRKFGVNGSLEYQVQGHTLSHYPADDRSEITRPEVVLHRDNVTWHIVSSRGELTRNPDVFRLLGEVTAQRELLDAEPLTIRTSNLHIDTQANQVHTDQPIEIIADGWQLRSVGLQSAIDAGKLNLLSNVTGHYEVAHDPDR